MEIFNYKILDDQGNIASEATLPKKTSEMPTTLNQRMFVQKACNDEHLTLFLHLLGNQDRCLQDMEKLSNSIYNQTDVQITYNGFPNITKDNKIFFVKGNRKGNVNIGARFTNDIFSVLKPYTEQRKYWRPSLQGFVKPSGSYLSLVYFLVPRDTAIDIQNHYLNKLRSNRIGWLVNKAKEQGIDRGQEAARSLNKLKFV